MAGLQAVPDPAAVLRGINPTFAQETQRSMFDIHLCLQRAFTEATAYAHRNRESTVYFQLLGNFKTACPFRQEVGCVCGGCVMVGGVGKKERDEAGLPAPSRNALLHCA